MIYKSLWMAGLIVVSGNAAANGIWTMCDTCVSDSDFELQALVAAGNYTPVYISNRETNETRKYDRQTVTTDLGDGLEQLTTVLPATFSSSEQAAFHNAIELASKELHTLARNDLTGLLPGVQDAGSVGNDIFLGPVDQGVVAAIRLYVEQEGLLPDLISINRHLEVEVAVFGQGAGSGQTIRVADLFIVVEYGDGSTLTVMRRGSDGKYMSWLVTDADGERILMQDDSDGGEGGSVAPGLFNPTEESFVFGFSASPQIQYFVDFVERNSNLECSATTTETPEGTRVVVTCRKP